MRVGFEYNTMFTRWDISLPYQMGDIKDMIGVAHVDKENRISFLKELTVPMVEKVILRWSEHREQLKRNPLDDLDNKIDTSFEPSPDGEGNV